MKDFGFIIKDPAYGAVRGLIEPDGTPLFCCYDIASTMGYKAPGKLISVMKRDSIKVDKRWIMSMPGAKKPIVYTNVCKAEVAEVILERLPALTESAKWVMEHVIPEAKRIGNLKVLENKR